jgi:uncharacterized protein (TIGR02118 family)
VTEQPSEARHVRCLVLLKKQDTMSQEEFDQYWRDVHGAIAAHYPNVVRYTQLHLLGEPQQEFADAEPISVSGIVDFVYTSIEDVPPIWESPEGLEGRADAPVFLAGALHCFVEETVVTDHLGLGSLTQLPVATEPARYP